MRIKILKGLELVVFKMSQNVSKYLSAAALMFCGEFCDYDRSYFLCVPF